MFIFIKKLTNTEKWDKSKRRKKILVLKSVLCFNVDILTSTGTKIQWYIYPLLKNNCSWITIFCWYSLPVKVPVYI